MKKTGILIVAILAAGLLAACGGGGSDGGGVNVDPGTTIINKDNVEDIAHRIIDSSLLGEDFVSDFGDLQIAGYNCVDQGNVSTTGSISEPPAVNDTITVTYNDCQEFGVIINGSMTVTIKEVSNNFDGTPPYNLKVEIVLSNLSSEAIDLGLVATVNGDMTISISDDNTGGLSVTIEGNSLTQQWDGEVETLSDFLIEMVDNLATGDYSINLNGTIGSTMLSGSVTFNTITIFTGNENIGTGEPTAGELLVINSIDNSQGLLTAKDDGTGLEIKVDADGDGEYEFQTFIPYGDL